MVHVVPNRAPVLTEEHKSRRLEWARKYIHLGPKWKNVIFSDEKKFNLDGPDGWHGYWHNLRKEKELFSKRQNGGGSVMVWAAFSHEGTSNLVILEGNQASIDYIATLRSNLLSFNEQKHGNSALFQHDNASIHRSRMTQQWLQEQEIDLMSWPALSPDLNPIENLWSVLARSVYEDNKQYHSIYELKMAILRCWEKISRGTIEKLILSMPKRCIDVLECKGAKIGY
jgi:transposase